MEKTGEKVAEHPLRPRLGVAQSMAPIPKCSGPTFCTCGWMIPLGFPEKNGAELSSSAKPTRRGQNYLPAEENISDPVFCLGS